MRAWCEREVKKHDVCQAHATKITKYRNTHPELSSLPATVCPALATVSDRGEVERAAEAGAEGPSIAGGASLFPLSGTSLAGAAATLFRGIGTGGPGSTGFKLTWDGLSRRVCSVGRTSCGTRRGATAAIGEGRCGEDGENRRRAGRRR